MMWRVFFFPRFQERLLRREEKDKWYGWILGMRSSPLNHCVPSLNRGMQFLIQGHNLEFMGPFKSSFFAWEASEGKVLIGNLLHKRGWSLTNRCVLCKREEESIDRILLHCIEARALMANHILFVWHCMDLLFYGQGNFTKLAWLFYGQKIEGGMEESSPKHFLDDLEGKESKGV